MSPFDSTGAQFAWDSTSLGWAESCLRKYSYYMIEGWRPIEGSVHLEFGGAYATALEHFHKHRAAGMDYNEAVIVVVHEALVNTWKYEFETLEQQEEFEKSGKSFWDYWKAIGSAADARSLGPIVWDHPTKTRANLIRTIVWYLEEFKDDPCSTVVLSDGTAAVEYSFSLELDTNILYCGHIDRLVEYPSGSGDIYVQDQKTTGSTITPRYLNDFSPSTQMSGYAFAGSIIYNSKVKGVMIDAAQIMVGFSRFERGFTFRTDSQLDEWRKDSLLHIAAARQATEQGYYPQNRSSCSKFGGCEFRKVCSLSPEVRPNFLRADFVQDKRWNPLERR